MNRIDADVYAGIEPAATDHVPGWNSRQPIFGELIASVRPQVIIEVGTWLGASAIEMASHCRAAGLASRIYCVDTWLGATEFWTTQADTRDRDTRQRNGYPQVYFDFLANVVRHGCQDMITPIPNTSSIGSRILAHHGITADLIYIDGSHEFEDVAADIRNYLPLLHHGGVMFGDDIDWPDVRRAVAQELPAAEHRGPFWLWQS